MLTQGFNILQEWGSESPGEEFSKTHTWVPPLMMLIAGLGCSLGVAMFQAPR